MSATALVLAAVLITSSISSRIEDNYFSFEITNDNRAKQRTESPGSGAIGPNWDEASGAVLTELGSSENVSEDKSSGAAIEELRQAFKISELLETCTAGKLPKKKYFVSSDDLIQNAMFPGQMSRYGGGGKDWKRVQELQNYKGNFLDPVHLTFEKQGGKVFLVVYDGRHRICAMRHQHVLTEVKVGCHGITSEKFSASAAGQFIPAGKDCQRAKDSYDREKRQEEKDRLERESRQQNYGGGFGFNPFGGGMGGFPY